MRSGKGALTEEVVAEAIQSQWSLTFEVRKRDAWRSITTRHAESQWSLTFEVRKRRQRHPAPRNHLDVAMEPDL